LTPLTELQRGSFAGLALDAGANLADVGRSSPKK
jgi:hypothetical protein